MLVPLIDYDLSFLQEALHLINRHLEILKNAANDDRDAEDKGLWDSIEYMTGLSFVVSQNYIYNISGRYKNK